MFESVTLYKIVCLCVGVAFAYMGYQLFMARIKDKAGELEVGYENYKLVLNGTAPGTFFVLFGMAIIIATVWQGLDIKENTGSISTVVNPTDSTQPLKKSGLPDAPPF